MRDVGVAFIGSGVWVNGVREDESPGDFLPGRDRSGVRTHGGGAPHGAGAVGGAWRPARAQWVRTSMAPWAWPVPKRNWASRGS